MFFLNTTVDKIRIVWRFFTPDVLEVKLTTAYLMEKTSDYF